MADEGWITRSILLIRGHKVLLDADLAELYGVETRVLNQSVRRNLERFRRDFMCQLAAGEWANLRSQIVIASVHGGRRLRPYVFTEQGVAMLSGVLKSPRAVAVNIEIMRASVELRRMLESTDGLARKLETLERKYDGQFAHVFEAIRQLVAPPKGGDKKIGFRND
ncbi:MAG: ORF6N domain-containing protein [Acidobacteria bacterium]|nr:ORF6N domain-containing protein [Acidobacteriota bacterium]